MKGCQQQRRNKKHPLENVFGRIHTAVVTIKSYNMSYLIIKYMYKLAQVVFKSIQRFMRYFVMWCKTGPFHLLVEENES